MSNPLEEIRTVLFEQRDMNVEIAGNLAGLDMFVRALAAELRERDPQLMNAVLQRLTEIDPAMIDTNAKSAGKRYAEVLARSTSVR